MQNSASRSETVGGVILAGGLSRRMGHRNKALLPLNGEPLIAHVLTRLVPQVATVAISANQDVETLKLLGHPVLRDALSDSLSDIGPDHPGPLAGLLAAMEWAMDCASASEQAPIWLACVPVDTPLLPSNFVSTLLDRTDDDVSAVIARSHGRDHPITGLFRTDLYADLKDWLASGPRRAGDWCDHIGAVRVDYGNEEPDPFFNINTPADLVNQAMRRALDS